MTASVAPERFPRSRRGAAEPIPGTPFGGLTSVLCPHPCSPVCRVTQCPLWFQRYTHLILNNCCHFFFFMLRSHHLLLTSILLLSYFHPCPRSDSQHSSRALPRFGSNGVPGIGVAIPGVYNTTFRWLLPAPAAPLPFGCGAARCGGVYGGKGGFLSRVSFADPLNIIVTNKPIFLFFSTVLVI